MFKQPKGETPSPAAPASEVSDVRLEAARLAQKHALKFRYNVAYAILLCLKGFFC
jgi:hypothetical protein